MKKLGEVILVFEIGKSEKKFFLLDRNFAIVNQGQTLIHDVFDDDNDPMDDLDRIEAWIWDVISNCLQSEKYHLHGINFSTYGASLVNIDGKGRRVSPFYHHSKSFPYTLFEDFTLQYSGGGSRVLESGSPGIGLINSGFQLYWLKYHKPETYRKIRWSLHLPQYFSYLLTGIPISEYTSLGCRTALWNYNLQEYDRWVSAEKVDRKLAPLVPAHTSINATVFNQRLKVGVGIQDTSAMLLPYLLSVSDPFILVSAGHWSVSLNPFCQAPLTPQDVDNGCLYYMQVNGQRVLANGLYLGLEYERQVQKLIIKYDTSISKIGQIQYNPGIDQTIRRGKQRYFLFEHIPEAGKPDASLPSDFNLKKAYHQLMAELVDLQVQSIERIIKDGNVRKIYIDGQFIKNELFVNMIANRLDKMKVYTSKSATGSALGAAIAFAPEWWSKKHFKKCYQVKRIR